MAKQRLPIRLLNGAGRLAWRFGLGPASFAGAEASLREAARRATGLDDFGDEACLDGLRVLLEAYQREARLGPFGRAMVWQQLAGILRTRLVVQEAWKRDPQARQAPVRRPLFILGLPRTGTTALHQLLAQDPERQVLDYWLAAAPGPRPPPERVARDPRYRRALRELRMVYWLDPGLRAIHDLTAAGPDECRHLLLQCFTDDTFDSNASLPSYTAWYAGRDMRASYAWHRDVLRLIQSPCGAAGSPAAPDSADRRWVLKYPAHLAHLQLLLETYPDACIVQTHRDPTRVLPSLCSLVSGWRSLYEDAVDVRAVARWQVELWAGRMERAMAVRERSDPARFLDLSFGALMADPIAAIRRIYAHFGDALAPAAEARMRAWQAAHPPGRHGGHHYTAEAFGLVPEQLAERFAAYCEHFGVEPEGVEPEGVELEAAGAD